MTARGPCPPLGPWSSKLGGAVARRRAAPLVVRASVALRLAAIVLTSALSLVLPREALAAVERFAVLIGNNVGAPGEIELRYAEDDAAKVYDVLKDLGGFPPSNMVLLKGEDEATVRRTLAAVNDRVRAATSAPGAQAILVVYYSGHADALALHLGGTTLEVAELGRIVRASPATFRLLVTDACRSGALTRVKGGSSAAPIAIRLDERFSGEGTVFLTSSSANEDAQESDEIKGSFFSHAWVSGLLGAADGDGDGAITLDEAYRHAYDATLRATSRTLGGVQHPTFQYDLRGQGDVVLTTPGRASRARASLSFPAGRSYLLLRGSSEGVVVGEVGPNDASRSLSVRPGRYFVRGRGKDFLLEGEVSVAPGEARDVGDDALSRVAYARLVRKGGSAVRVAHGPQAGYRFRTPLPNGEGLCHGFYAGYAAAFEDVTVSPRLGACRSGFRNEALSAETLELDFEVRLAHAWDFSRLSVELGTSLGGALFRQVFETPGLAPPRATAAGFLGASVGVAFEIASGFHALADVTGQTYFFELESESGAAVEASFALRPSVGLGKHF